MSYGRDDVRRLFVDMNEDVMEEVFSPMKSLAVHEEFDLVQERNETVQALVEAFIAYLSNAGIDVSNAPQELVDGVRFVVGEAFERGRLIEG